MYYTKVIKLEVPIISSKTAGQTSQCS